MCQPQRYELTTITAVIARKVKECLEYYTVSQRKVATFKLSVTLSNLNQCLFFCAAGKSVKLATKPQSYRMFKGENFL